MTNEQLNVLLNVIIERIVAETNTAEKELTVYGAKRKLQWHSKDTGKKANMCLVGLITPEWEEEYELRPSGKFTALVGFDDLLAELRRYSKSLKMPLTCK